MERASPQEGPSLRRSDDEPLARNHDSLCPVPAPWDKMPTPTDHRNRFYPLETCAPSRYTRAP